MGLLSFFRPDKTPPRAEQRAREDIELVRVRARRRLIGAVVLVTAAVVGLPWLLETQPRPLSVDIAGEVSREGASTIAGAAPAAPRPVTAGDLPAQARPGEPLAQVRPVGATATATATTSPGVPAISAPSAVAAVAPVAPLALRPQDIRSSIGAASRPAQSTVAPVTAGARPPVLPAPAPKVAPAPVRPAPTLTEVRPPPPARPAAPAKADETRTKAAPEAKAPVAVAVAPRFVVQVGAFEHATAAHETRGKVEKLGLKAYEQEVDAGGARRIRVRLGPYASREEAERMLARLRASGMNASVMPQ
jgi:DedD protein